MRSPSAPFATKTRDVARNRYSNRIARQGVRTHQRRREREQAHLAGGGVPVGGGVGGVFVGGGGERLGVLIDDGVGRGGEKERTAHAQGAEAPDRVVHGDAPGFETRRILPKFLIEFPVRPPGRQ